MAEHDAAGATELRLHLLVLRCQAGDERAFTQLFDWFGERSLRYLRGLVGDAADDVQQEVWLSVYRNISSLAKPGAFRTWLFSTTRHRALDYLRGEKRERELLEDVAEEMREASDESALDARVDAALDAAITELSPAHREVLLLRYRNNMSYAEIALVVGAPIGTVRTRLHHAKRRLQELLT
jgi:RNA polymerase sigma-70 factor (ECF subfamily)